MPPMRQCSNPTWKSVPIVTVTWRYFIALRSITYRRCLFAFRQISFQPAADPRLFLLLWEGIDLIQAVDRGYLLSSPPRTSWCLATLFVSGQLRDMAAIQSQFLGETLCIERILSYLLCDTWRIVSYKVCCPWQRRGHARHLPYSHESSGK